MQGIPRAFVREQSDELLAQVQLQGVVGVRTGRYSGGMRRRLSVAIALLGTRNRQPIRSCLPTSVS